MQILRHGGGGGNGSAPETEFATRPSTARSSYNSRLIARACRLSVVLGSLVSSIHIDYNPDAPARIQRVISDSTVKYKLQFA